MRSFFVASILIIAWHSGLSQYHYDTKFKTPFEQSKGKETAGYEEIIDHYKTLDEHYTQAKLTELGPSDAGEPLHLFVVSQDMIFDPHHPSRKDKTVIMIMNGIHPGESDGIDASMIFFDVILNGQEEMKEFKDLIFVVFPVYNVGGCKNQKPYRRANQNGPTQFGSRGNARNLDLNRDFIKADSRNTRLFQKAFVNWDPDLFLDTHVSNGADYSYTNTLLSTGHDKLYKPQKELLKSKLEPFLFQKMKRAGHEMTPYVNVFGKDPLNGYAQFFDSPRYSTGFAAIHHTLGFMLENHMLKPYRERVYSTFDFLLEFGRMGLKYREEIKETKRLSKTIAQDKTVFPIQWDVDFDREEKIMFKGFQRVWKISSVTDDTLWYYDREKPYEEEISFYEHFNVSDSVSAPFAYHIPFAWENVAKELKRNGVKLTRIDEPDEHVEAMRYRIVDLETSQRMNGGHHYHWKVGRERVESNIRFEKGDYLVYTDQQKVRFIMETLEPTATDSYFRWNYFDPILQRHEWFSTYVFDAYAEEFLNNNPEVKREFEERKIADREFASSPYLQYLFIFEKSPYKEPEYRLYPISRIEKISAD